MRSTIRRSVRWPGLTLLASPDSTGGGLGRACVVSRRRMFCFHIFVKRNNYSDPQRLFVRMDAYQYQSDISHVRSRVVKQVLRSFHSMSI